MFCSAGNPGGRSGAVLLPPRAERPHGLCGRYPDPGGKLDPGRRDRVLLPEGRHSRIHRRTHLCRVRDGYALRQREVPLSCHGLFAPFRHRMAAGETGRAGKSPDLLPGWRCPETGNGWHSPLRNHPGRHPHLPHHAGWTPPFLPAADGKKHRHRHDRHAGRRSVLCDQGCPGHPDPIPSGRDRTAAGKSFFPDRRDLLRR